MKIYIYNTLFIFFTFFIISCSSDDDLNIDNIDETENLHLIKSFDDQNYTLELFSSTEKLTVGYNQIYLRLTDKNGNYIENASIDWKPMMTMNMEDMTHQHSSPFSEITKAEDKQTLFEGYIVFTMPSDGENNYWELNLNFSVENENVELKEKVEVISTESDYHKVYTSKMGEDEVNYLLALVEPTTPEIGTNDIVVALFKSTENDEFPIVDDYQIKVDPRMPGMGNHSAPGNEDMTQKEDGFYHGKVGFSMSGYWKINLLLENQSGTKVAGNSITEDQPES